MSNQIAEQAEQPTSLLEPLLSDDADTNANVSKSQHQDSSTNVTATSAAFKYSFCAALNSCNLGYDIGINTSAANLVHDSLNLSDTQLELFLGSVNLFAMVGALFSQFISDHMGRIKAFQVSAMVFITGILTMATAQNYATLECGRMFVGLGIGLGMAIDSLYISEISPAESRGSLVTLTGISINVAVLIGFSFGLIYSAVPDDLAWRYMYATGTVLPVIMLCLCWFVLPESPRWLIKVGREEEARLSLRKIHPPDFDTEIILQDIKQSIARDNDTQSSFGWKFILRQTLTVRRILLVSIGTAIAQQAVGIDVIQYYLVYILKESNIDSRPVQGAALLFLGFIKVIFVIFSGYLFDTKGRKPILYISLSGMILGLLILSINCELQKPSGPIAIFALTLYVSLYSLGMGPGAWLIPSEILPISIRGKALSLATFSNRVTGMIMVSTCLSVVDVITWAGYFLLLTIVCFIILIFFCFFLPETKGKSLEEMAQYFSEITGDETETPNESLFLGTNESQGYFPEITGDETETTKESLFSGTNESQGELLLL